MGDSKHSSGEADTEEAAAVAAGEAAPWRDGLRLGDRYVLRRFLGKGGMGQVWVAWDELLVKEVALKRVRPDLVRADGLEPLRREVLLAQTVTHVNVCRIYDLEPLAGDWVIKMELVGGRSLGELLAENPGGLPIERTLFIARQLARGLAAVHGAGIVHRDLKPSNVLVDDDGRVVLMDFGIARAGAPTGDTEPSQIAGTPEYMAPEQARGEPVDGRADLYAFGCVLYRMLTGEVPFPAATRVVAMARHLTDPPPDARARRPETPAWLARLTQALMAKRPGDRPRHAVAVAARLAGPPPLWPRLVVAATTIVLLAALVAVGVAGWRAHVRERWRPALAELPTEYDANSARTLPSDDGQLLAFDGRRNDEARVFVGPVAGGGRLVATPPGHHLLGWLRSGRGLLVEHEGHLARFWLADGRVEPTGIAMDGAADCGSAGLVLAEPAHDVCVYCERLVLQRPDGSRRELVAPDKHLVPSDLLTCDAAGRRVGYTAVEVPGAQDHVFVRALDADAPVEIPDSAQHQAIKMGSFTDRDTIVINALDGKTTHVWELPLHGGRARQLGFAGDEFLPTATRDGRLFYAIVRRNAVVYRQPIGGGPATRLTFGEEVVDQLVETPDGKALILNVRRAYSGSEVLVYHPLDGGSEEVLTPPSDSITLATHFLDGQLYYQPQTYGSERSPIRALSLADRSTREILTPPSGAFIDVGDGYAHLLTESGAVRVPLDGSPPSREAPAPWIGLLDSPSGWRAAIRDQDDNSAAFFPPGAALSGPPSFTLTLQNTAVWSRDGRAIIFPRDGKIFRRELASAKETTLAQPGDATIAYESVDGKSIYYIQFERRVRRQVMTNFAERPPL